MPGSVNMSVVTINATTLCSWKEFEQRIFIPSWKNENRHYVKQVARVLTGRQKIAQRGHKEDVNSPNKSNVLEILELMNEQDDIVKNRFTGKSRVKYTSPKIQNEILALLAQIIDSSWGNHQPIIHERSFFTNGGRIKGHQWERTTVSSGAIFVQ